jgi:hypothetical protein
VPDPEIPQQTQAELPLTDDFQSGGVTEPSSADSSTGTVPADDGLLSVVEGLKQFGYTPQATGDYQALREVTRLAQEASQLRQRAQAADFYSRLGQQIAQLPPEQLRTLQEPVAAAPTRQPWEPPQFNRDYMALVDQDPGTGKYVSKPGVPPEVGRAVNEYNDWLQGFLHNPTQIISQAAEHVAKQQFDRLFQERWAQQQAQTEVQQILAQNASWMYQRDTAGQMMRDASGNPLMSREGGLYSQAVRQLNDAGVTSPAQKNALAIQIVRGQLAAEQASGQSVAQQVAPRQAQALNSGRPNVNPLQALSADQRAATPGAIDPSLNGLGFRDRLLKEFAAAGITDADFSPESFGP